MCLHFSLWNPWLTCQNKYFSFSMGSVVQCLLLALALKEHFLLSQRMRKEPAKGNLLLHGSLVRQREAGPPKSAEILIYLAPVIAGLHFFSLAPISWLCGEQEGRSLDGHSAALASGQPQAGQTSAPASKHCRFAFITYTHTSSTAFLKLYIIIFYI